MAPEGMKGTNAGPFNWFRRSFPMKLATWMLLVAGVPLVAVMIWTAGLVAQTMTETLNAEAQALLTTSMVAARQHLNTYEGSMQVYMTAPRLQSPDPAVKREIMARLVNAHSNFRWIGFVDLHGKLVIDTLGRTGKDFSQTEAFKEGLKGMNVSNAEPSQNLSYVPAVMYSTPIRSDDGTKLGVLLVEVDLQPLVDTFSQGRIRLSGETYLVKGNGAFLTPPRFAPWLSSERVASYGFQQAMAGHSGVAEYKDYRGVKVIGAYAPFFLSERPGSPRWAILSEVDVAEATTPVHDVLQAIALVTLLLLGLVGVLAVFVSRQVSLPLVRLKSAAQRVTQGDWSQRADDGTPDEIGQLGQAFNSMAAKVEEVITALTTANQALDASERRFRLVVNNAPVILFSSTPDGMLTFAEGRGLASMQETTGPLVGQPIAQAIHESPSFLASIRRALSGEIDRDEVQLGAEIFQVWYSLLRNQRGDVINMIGVASNVTELKKLEAQLAEAQRIAHIGNWERDLKTNRLQWSLEHYRILGLEPQASELTSELFRNHIHPADRARIDAALRRTYQEGLPFDEDFRVIRPSGEVRVLHSIAEVICDSDGRPIRAVGTAQDITERKRLEETLREQYTKLQELDQLKTDFINAISHDLRTPITSIMGYTEFLEDGLAGPLEPEQLEFVTQIERSNQRLAGMVNDLLDFARIEAGTFLLACEPVDLTRTMREGVEAMRPMLDGSNLRLELDLPEDCPWVEADADRMERVIANLLSNAIKFTPSGGLIRVAARTEGDEFVGEVTDTGPGIAPEDRDKLFKRFSQLNSGRQQKGGTGLGLSICKSIIESHGGTIGVTSQPGHGATFWFRLPMRSAHAAHADGPYEEAAY